MRPQFRSIGAFVVMLLLLGAILPAATAAPQPAAGGEKININTASADDLASLPGIGPSYAQRIVEYREKNGPFHKVEDLLNVRGIGEKTFERIRDRLTLGAK